jgi:hyaluronoglucosaminidase
MDGVIEGFYGPDWTVANTEAMFAFMAKHHLNTFVYAPKYDPYQRADWMKPYPPKNFAALAAIVHSAQAHHITFVYSVSPGLSIDYQSATDRKLLLGKINQVRSLGVTHFMLSFDDIGGNLTAALATEQAQLADFVLHEERLHERSFSLMFTPTLYDGLSANPYWAALKTSLYQGISVIWTGPYVLSETITTEDAERVKQLIGHNLVIWDNYPVNDYTYLEAPYHPHLFLGPVVGRSAGLTKVVSAYFFNPMIQAQASEVALWTGAAYLNNPDGYQPLTAWNHAIETLGGKAASSFRLFAEANSESFLAPSMNTLAAQVSTFWAKPPLHPLRSGLAQTFSQMAVANQAMKSGLSDRVLYQQMSPWSQLFSEEGQAGSDALTLWSAAKAGHAPNAASIDHLQTLEKSIAKSTLSLDTTATVQQFVTTVLARLS